MTTKVTKYTKEIYKIGKNIFYHGTSIEAAESIYQIEFRVWLKDKYDGWYYPFGGNLGAGIYITDSWRIALRFGPVLLRVTIIPGTKILDSSKRHDTRVIKYFQKEFGLEIIRKPPWEALPPNKKLTLSELINLFRYHYRQTWERDDQIAPYGSQKWRK